MCAPCVAGDVAARVIIFLVWCGVQCINEYCFVVSLYLEGGAARIVGMVLLVFWVVINVLWIWTYLKVCWLDPGSVLRDLKRYGYADADGALKELPPVLDALPKCPKCGLPKPERTHHCSRCGRCYFRFDHHCPVVGNCIALHNMRAFILFGVYGGLVFLFFIIYAILAFIMAPRIPRAVTACVALLAFFFMVGLFGFSWSWVPFVCKMNKTTLEGIGNMDIAKYDLGEQGNREQIFGKNRFMWIFPTDAAVSGFFWSGITDLNNLPETLPDLNEQPPDEDSSSASNLPT